MPWESADTCTAGPTGPTADPMPTAAPKTATSPRPKVASLSGVFMASRSGGVTASAARHLVTGLLYGGPDGALVDRRLAGDGEPAAGEVDVDAGDAGDPGDLLGDRADAVTAGHSDDGVGGGAHARSLREVGERVRSGRGGRWPRRPRAPSPRPRGRRQRPPRRGSGSCAPRAGPARPTG